MALRNLSDAIYAYENGQSHISRFYKGNNATIKDGFWQDWSFAAGQPSYDARIGISGQFNPYIASKNDAIYIPDISAGMERRLARIVLATTASGASQASLNVIAYDLLGVYPLIDGDSLDLQQFDNSQPLPRYTNGVGVFPVLVNHVAPMVQQADGTMVYTDTNGVDQTVAFGVSLGVAGCVVSSAISSAVAGSQGSISMPLKGSSGCLAVNQSNSTQRHLVCSRST